MKEYGGLCYPGLLKVFFGSGKHDIGKPEAEDLIGLLE
jgi:hypothetical protein